MQIKQISKPDDVYQQFQKEAWADADIKHYGHAKQWLDQKFYLQAMIDRQIVGAIAFKLHPGVIHLEDLVVAGKYRRKGVGKKLILAMEKIAKKPHAHKIDLTTGKNWPSVKFYKRLGYNVLMELKHHFYGDDFIYLVKNLYK